MVYNQKSLDTGYPQGPCTMNLPTHADLSPAAFDLLERLLEVNPSDRLRSLMALSRIAFFHGYNIDDFRKMKIVPLEVIEKHEKLREDELRSELIICNSEPPVSDSDPISSRSEISSSSSFTRSSTSKQEDKRVITPLDIKEWCIRVHDNESCSESDATTYEKAVKEAIRTMELGLDDLDDSLHCTEEDFDSIESCKSLDQGEDITS